MQPNVIISIKGEPKSGKTYLALTATEPIKVYAFDTGVEYVKETKFPNKDIIISRFRVPVLDDEDDVDVWALPIWDDFRSQFVEDVEGQKYNSLVIDTGTNLELILRQAILEHLQQEKPEKQKLATNEYYSRNLRMSAIYDRCQEAGLNLIVTHYLKERWVKHRNSDRAEPTGELILDGWNQTEGKADINIEMEAVQRGKGNTVMVSTIVSNRFNRDLAGESFDDTDFDELMAVTFEEEE